LHDSHQFVKLVIVDFDESTYQERHLWLTDLQVTEAFLRGYTATVLKGAGRLTLPHKDLTELIDEMY
jgi:hypothetical protein